jgi:hypothetical protein
MSEANTLFEIDRELDSLLDQIEEQAEETGAASPEVLERFQQFCQAESDKVDRIGRFLTLMDKLYDQTIARQYHAAMEVFRPPTD